MSRDRLDRSTSPKNDARGTRRSPRMSKPPQALDDASET
jgi:hypothetical protein